MKVPIINHPDYVAQIGDDHRFPIKKFGELIKLLKKDGILIIHRHKKDKIVITEKINILDTRTYGVSKVYFAN